ncbi:hypothetical protein H5410_010297 [Solanum commersonii]|uniref:Uncharacterized protein n=1 Tax=Solanum commersonii TaxID=4109 RepID=A0A9J6AM22_SOLCO|nr:hypothetical protein H5410_010297 [Solanum commersonii]
MVIQRLEVCIEMVKLVFEFFVVFVEAVGTVISQNGSSLVDRNYDATTPYRRNSGPPTSSSLQQQRKSTCQHAFSSLPARDEDTSGSRFPLEFPHLRCWEALVQLVRFKFAASRKCRLRILNCPSCQS